MTKIADLRAMTPDQISEELLKLKKEQFNLRFQAATGQLEKPTAWVKCARTSPASRRFCARSRLRLKGTKMPKRILEGVVVSDKGDKTVVVKVERTLLHPVLKKTVRLSKKYHAHDEANALKVGDLARIVECAPKSKLKRWEVVADSQASAS